MYKAAIIGCGRMGVELPDCHANAYRDCPQTELVMVCDIDASKAREAGERLGVSWCADVAEVWSGGMVDIISICTPPNTHAKVVREVVSHKPQVIYLEKPIAETLDGADEIIKLCAEGMVLLQVNHQRRFTNPKFRFSRGILNTGTHAFDLIEQLFGRIVLVSKFTVETGQGIKVNLQYIDTDEPIFELDCTHNKDRMTLSGVKALCKALDTGYIKSTGMMARRALEACLTYQDLIHIQ